MLWKLITAGENRPLSAAELALLLRLRFALQEYEDCSKIQIDKMPIVGNY